MRDRDDLLQDMSIVYYALLIDDISFFVCSRGD